MSPTSKDRTLQSPSAQRPIGPSRFIIEGTQPLRGEYRVQGNKNAALPLMAASLLSEDEVELRNVPSIVDVDNMVRLIEATGVTVREDGNRRHIQPSTLQSSELPSFLIEKLRGGILLLGVLATRFDRLSCALPGGCLIGRRSFDVHWSVFRAAGFRVEESKEGVEISRVSRIPMPRVYLEEASVTATENALLLFSGLGGGVVENPAREPHVLSLVSFLRSLGHRIDLHPLSFEVGGKVRRPGRVQFSVPGDFIDAGTLAIAAAVTRGEVLLQGVNRDELLGILPFLGKFGIDIQAGSETCWSVRAGSLKSPDQITAGPWPLFPTDLVSLSIVLATQSEGLCLIHDWMYEARMFFVDKLVRMGGKITMCDPHRVLVQGPKPLKATRLESPDIRAGMALVVAGLCARGRTIIEHAEVIKRGYEAVVPRLRSVGADIREE